MMKPEFMEKYPELLEDAWRKLSERLQEVGYAREQADEAAFRMTEYLRQEWSGRMLYILKKKDVPREKQDDLFQNQAAPAAAEATSNVLTEAQLTAIARSFSRILGEAAPERADSLGMKLLELLRSDWAGTSLFVPKGVVYETTRRDYVLWRAWDGSYRSKLALMRQYGIGEQAFYAAIRRIRKAHLLRTQMKLPGVEG